MEENSSNSPPNWQSNQNGTSNNVPLRPITNQMSPPKLPYTTQMLTNSVSSPTIMHTGTFKKSSSFETDGYVDGTIMMHIRNLENQVRSLQSELATLKRKMSVFEDDTNRNRWGIRYSRRMAIMSNLMLGLWIFWSKFMKHVQTQKKSRLLGVVMGTKKQTPLHSLNSILYEAVMKATKKSWIFFFAAFLLTRHVDWKRHFGLTISTSYSLYLAMFSHFLPWTNYFNMFANLLYITSTAWHLPHTGESSSLEDFIQ